MLAPRAAVRSVSRSRDAPAPAGLVALLSSIAYHRLMSERSFLMSAAAAACLVACGSSGGTSGPGGAASTSGTGASPMTTASGGNTSGSGGQSGVGHAMTFTNACSETIWVGALNAADYELPENGGWKLDPGQSHTIVLPEKWGGRFWGRSGCTFDENGKGKCDSGDCGGKALCNGSGGKPPATLVEFTFAGFGGKDFYDVSLVDGYNLPMGVAPKPGTFTASDPNDAYDCGSPACTSDVNLTCPPELQLENAANEVVGCRSPHQACNENPQDPALKCADFDDLYQCIGGGPNGVDGSCYSPGATATCCGCPSWSPPGACKSTNPKWALPSLPEKYAKVFKDACPTGYSFPYDDQTSTYTCKGDDYVITFCP
ncbi:Ornithine carbamoyltransferase [Minicystis rosea]|nr:Ornithine carbamoyltransferase [Minicystis rosea]